MKLLSLFFIAMLFVVVAGCDGDGDGGGDTATATEENGTVEEPKGPVTIATGSKTLDIFSDNDFSIPFTIPGTGVIEARIEWSSPPSTLSIDLVHASSVGVFQDSIQSPAILQLQATQDLLDDSNAWVVNVKKLPDDEFTFNYTIRLMPD